MNRRFSLLLLVLCSTAQASVQSPAERTFETSLDNGMRIIVREDHRAPVMVSQVWYRVGSSYEPNGRSGISHIVEHMLFKGTPKVPTGEFSKLVAQYGGVENAFTSYDYTGYYQMMSANNLALSLELEADRMQNALMPEAEFVKEIEVIKEERRLRIDDKPNSKAYERFMAAANIANGYHQPIIGWMHDLHTITRDEVYEWYQTWYHPGNAILVVVGAVDHESVFAMAERFFGPIPGRATPRVPVVRDIAPLGERRLQVNVPAKVPALYMGYNVPAINTADNPDDVYALRMLAGVLDGGYSARLETRLVRNSRVASSASAGYGGFALGDTLFTLSGIPSAEHSLAELETALLAEIERLQTDLADPAELARVRAQVVSSVVYQQDSIASQAVQMGRLESIGRSWRDMDELPTRLEAVTPEQLRDVARRYLTADRRTVAYLNPTEH